MLKKALNEYLHTLITLAVMMVLQQGSGRETGNKGEKREE